MSISEDSYETALYFDQEPEIPSPHFTLVWQDVVNIPVPIPVRVAIVGASNLEDFVKCTCHATCTDNRHLYNIPEHVQFKVFWAAGGRHVHKIREKRLEFLVHQAFSWKPTHLFVFPDILLNQMSKPPSMSAESAQVRDCFQVTAGLRQLAHDCVSKNVLLFTATGLRPPVKGGAEDKENNFTDLALNTALKVGIIRYLSAILEKKVDNKQSSCSSSLIFCCLCCRVM